MSLHHADESVTLWHGDCLDVLRELTDCSVDSIVTDPPYGLGFMGKAWDDLPPGVEWAAECLRVLKPGGHLLAFGGSRTWHRLAAAVEDAGFEIRDSIAWLYGSGFPKSLDVSKAIDKVNGEGGRLHKFTAWMRSTGITSRELDIVTGTNMGGHYLTAASQPAIPTPALWALIRPLVEDVPEWIDLLIERVEAERLITQQGKGAHVPGEVIGFDQRSSTDRERRDIPATPAAEQWQGWGTALKPAFEPVVVGRRPLVGTVAANVLAHGTGALNIDGCRIEAEPDRRMCGTSERDGDIIGFGARSETRVTAGRWPANVVLDESQAAALDEQSGTQRDGVATNRNRDASELASDAGWGFRKQQADVGYGSGGGASRFFYVAKAPKSERPRSDDGTAHPTVKPLALMRWLVRLVTPPGGVVLEPFAGSGTTVEACLLEGFQCIAIEREADYLPLIEARIARVSARPVAPDLPSLFDLDGVGA